MVQKALGIPSPLGQYRADTAGAPKVAAVFPALLFVFPLQFSLKKVLSPLNSIVAKLKKMSNRSDEILWDRIISIDYASVSQSGWRTRRTALPISSRSACTPMSFAFRIYA